jgi:hypothetical protein
VLPASVAPTRIFSIFSASKQIAFVSFAGIPDSKLFTEGSAKTSRLTTGLQSCLTCFANPDHDASHRIQRVFIGNKFDNLAQS